MHEKFDQWEEKLQQLQPRNNNPETTTNAKGSEELFTGWRGTGWLIDNHYMAQAMSDEPIDLGMCEKVHLLSGPTC
jgi:hypothetical protein